MTGSTSASWETLQPLLERSPLRWLLATSNHAPHFAPSLTAALRPLWDPDHPEACMVVRSDEVFAVGTAARVAALLTASPPFARAWVEREVWLHPSARSLHDVYVEAERFVHLQRPTGAGASTSAAGPARTAELSDLRALDTQQYGSPIPGFDYARAVARRVVWVARAGDRVVASAWVLPVGDFVCVSGLWTQPGERRRGHAFRLMQAILQDPSWLGGVCCLNVGRANLAAGSLYRRLGFHQHGEMVVLTPPPPV